jgi:hypothetical protein
VTTDARETKGLWLSDWGPPKPIAPVAAALPQGSIDDPAYILAVVEFWPTMEAHAKAMTAYTAASIDYAEWHSRYGDWRETLENQWTPILQWPMTRGQ